jgi:hypothetical protein
MLHAARHSHPPAASAASASSSSSRCFIPLLRSMARARCAPGLRVDAAVFYPAPEGVKWRAQGMMRSRHRYRALLLSLLSAPSFLGF